MKTLENLKKYQLKEDMIDVNGGQKVSGSILGHTYSGDTTKSTTRDLVSIRECNDFNGVVDGVKTYIINCGTLYV